MHDAGFSDEPRFSLEQAVRIMDAAVNRIRVEGYRLEGLSDLAVIHPVTKETQYVSR